MQYSTKISLVCLAALLAAGCSILFEPDPLKPAIKGASGSDAKGNGGNGAAVPDTGRGGGAISTAGEPNASTPGDAGGASTQTQGGVAGSGATMAVATSTSGPTGTAVSAGSGGLAIFGIAGSAGQLLSGGIAGASVGGGSSGGVANGGAISIGGGAGTVVGGASNITTGSIATGGGPPDNTAPVAIVYGPAEDGVNPDAKIAVTFTETMNCDSVTASSFSVVAAATQVAVPVKLACNGATATLTPTNLLNINADYTVTLTSAITDLAGNALSNAPLSWAFRTREGRWASGQYIDSLDASDLRLSPDLAIDTNGNAVVVWTRWNGTQYTVWGNRYAVDSLSWGTAQTIQSNTSMNADRPVIGADADGDFLVVWAQGPGTNPSVYKVWSNRFVSGVGWSRSAIPVVTNNSTSADMVSVAVQSNGDAVSVWRQVDPNGLDATAWSSRFNASSGQWSSAQMFFSTGSPCSVAVDNNGFAMALSTSSESPNVFSSESEPGKSFGTAVAIESNVSGVASWGPTVRFDPSSTNFLGVWTVDDGSMKRSASKRWDRTAGWQTDVSRIEGSEYFSVSSVDLAMNSQGTAIATWTAYDPGSDTRMIKVSMLPSGELSWPRYPTTLRGGNSNEFSQLYPRAAIDPNGNAVVVWHEKNANTTSVWARRYVKNLGTWTAAEQLSPSGAGPASEPKIAMDPSGNALVAWIQSDGATTRAWAAWFR